MSKSGMYKRGRGREEDIIGSVCRISRSFTMLVVFLSLVAVAFGCAPIDPNNPNAPTVVPGTPTVAPGDTHKVATITIECSPHASWTHHAPPFADAGQSANVDEAKAAQERDVDAAIMKSFTDAEQTATGVTSEAVFTVLDNAYELTATCTGKDDTFKLAISHTVFLDCDSEGENGSDFAAKGVITVTAATPMTKLVWDSISGSVLGNLAGKCIPRGPVVLSFP